MTKKNYPKMAPINLPKSKTFKYCTAVNANHKCASITVHRRLNDMIAEGTLVRVKHGTYRKNVNEEQMQMKFNEQPPKSAANMMLSEYLSLGKKEQVKVLEKALRELVNEGTVVKHGDRYSVA